jgi:hypothetical protein
MCFVALACLAADRCSERTPVESDSEVDSARKIEEAL